MNKLAFVGVGNMAQAMINGLVANGYPADSIYCHRRNLEVIRFLEDKGAVLCPTLEQAVSNADIVVLAVKPWQIVDIASNVASLIRSNCTVISVAAGINYQQIRDVIPNNPIVRMMPNTPVAVGEGVIGCFSDDSEKIQKLVDETFGSLGLLAWLENEDTMHALTAISGCGPAYFFRFMEHLANIGAELGLPPSQSPKLALQTMKGAAHLAEQSSLDFSQLVGQVISKGSATGMALETFHKEGLEQCLQAGIAAAYTRSKELANKEAPD